jgi:hypothetical protein
VPAPSWALPRKPASHWHSVCSFDVLPDVVASAHRATARSSHAGRLGGVEVGGGVLLLEVPLTVTPIHPLLHLYLFFRIVSNCYYNYYWHPIHICAHTHPRPTGRSPQLPPVQYFSSGHVVHASTQHSFTPPPHPRTHTHPCPPVGHGARSWRPGPVQKNPLPHSVGSMRFVLGQ